ncbi:hypothetical protein MTO96_050395 [Rhipicephalus appendiculatus]
MRSRRPRWEGLPHPAMCEVRNVRPRHDRLFRPVPPLRRGTRDGRLLTAKVVCGGRGGEIFHKSESRRTGGRHTCGDDTASRDNVEEAQVGKSDNPQEEAPIKDWSTWADDSSLSLPATKDSTSLTDTESLSGASQAQTPSIASPGASSTPAARWPPGETPLARGRGPQIGRPPNTPQDQQPLSPISRVLKQSRDPSLRNPLNQIIGVLGQDSDMQVDKPDLKRPHHSSSSSTDELGNPRKQAATETSLRTEGPPGSKPPDT